MFYPKFIYENLPYAYFTLCAYLLAFYDSWAVFFSAGLFYCAGCITLVTRSSFRRIDRYKDTSNHKNTIPEFLYEYLPYIYVAVAMTLVLKVSLPALHFFAFALMILALRNFLLRKNNRRKPKSLF